MNLRKIFLYTLIISVAVSAVLGIGVILFGSFGELESRVLMTTFTITLTSILGLACGAYYESKQARILPVTGIVFSLLAAMIGIYLIWAGDGGVDAIWKSAATASLLATSIALLCLISLATLDKRFGWSRTLIYISVTLLSAILLYILWFEPESSSDFVGRIIAVLSIVIAALTVMTPVFHRLSQKETGVAEIDAEIEKLRARIAELQQKRSELA
ncbi:MAG: hypothetical protein QM785_05120 [Pyrinomonadaceae bacterium]